MIKSYSIKTFYYLFILLFLIPSNTLFSQYKLNPDTVKAKRFDTGKMWTYDYPPYEYWKETYNFNADEDWMNHVQHSTLRIPGCTASFASEDGLVITNYHCGTWHRDAVEEVGEDLFTNGFFAESLDEERKVPNMYADQLMLIRDVTDQIHSAMEAVDTPEEKIKAKDDAINELVKQYSEETGLKCEVKSYYGGGKYALHGFKRYNDVRLVFIPEDAIGMFGGDPDNFTYPRYNLDMSIFRIYDDNGQPLKTDNFFKWDTSGVDLGELLFISGSPGTTSRLKTAAQLEYYRDITYRNLAYQSNAFYNQLYKLLAKYPDRHNEFAEMLLFVGNSQKVFTNILKGLNDPYLIARKAAFDKELKSKVDADPELKAKFGHVWKAIAANRDEARKYAPRIAAYTLRGRYSPAYVSIANSLIELAEQLQKDEDSRDPAYKGDQLEETINNIFPEKFDKPVENAKLDVMLGYIKLNLGPDNKFVKMLMDSKDGEEAVKYFLEHSKITTKEDVQELANEGAEAILNSNDPLISYILQTRDVLAEIRPIYNEISETESVLEQQLGEAMFAVYGTSIPPDANRSMRIGDGTVKTVKYNGTIAPYRTTYYGLFNRYYSHMKKYPWDLPKKWVNYPDNFKLSTTMDFITDIDVIGGQSGSPIVNREGNFVGVAFDGNIESIIGSFIYMPKTNRSIVVSAEGMIQALSVIYKADRIVKEILNGKIVK